ncbi:VOC family protein [Conexibacter woesei]|uniref:Glyoxalase/bleomycin resistance protein/dioxygenase n=1 Tax=Conexibacter woesei (strain DSM 14684 / CCUG 47730 / CIP 108061 / JCM 11494 / NBRC 100937 / ID131577) TaxID=469383 RepID=D3FF55_CONWI|nr:VOC family protein [Conexibacter woesei]ADB51772.1 Glyoxalase/bleomycin resistance protein/dioxygenase [Conexibacter woesei DSM 14684]
MSATAITHIGTVVVPVADQDAALAFYVGTLGFEVRIDAPFGDGARWIEVAPPGAQTSIALVPRDAAPAGVEVSLATRDAAADHAALREAAVDADAELIRIDEVPPMFTFRDADGNRLRMVERD